YTPKTKSRLCKRSLSAKCEIIFEKVTSMETTVRNTDQAITFLNESLLEANSYRRRWGLRLQGMKEDDQQGNTWDLVIKVLGKISPKIAEKLPEVVDSVHRIGKRTDSNSARGIIIQFSMRHFRDIVWRDARGSKFLEEAHLRLKEDLSPDKRVARTKAWPLVKKAREEGKRASFVGAFAYIEGKKFLSCFVISYRLLMFGGFFIHMIRNIRGQIMLLHVSHELTFGSYLLMQFSLSQTL
uniref:Uncharacterized protein n=1 Tax=Sinocyclocheilus grahami TaxID=75366 RepID=A0A672PHK9_SINGR